MSSAEKSLSQKMITELLAVNKNQLVCTRLLLLSTIQLRVLLPKFSSSLFCRAEINTFEMTKAGQSFLGASYLAEQYDIFCYLDLKWPQLEFHKKRLKQYSISFPFRKRLLLSLQLPLFSCSLFLSIFFLLSALMHLSGQSKLSSIFKRKRDIGRDRES